MSKPRRYSTEFKLDAVSRMEHCETITGLAKELGIRRKFYTSGVISYGPAAKQRWSGA
jgi:transposase-like protein